MSTPLIVGIDLAVQAIKELLESSAMADALTAVWLDRADGLPLPGEAFEKVFDYELDPETIAERFYAIVTAPSADRDAPFRGISDSTTDDVTNHVSVSIVINGDDPAIMTKQVQRTIAAVRECARANLMTLIPYSIRGSEVRLGREDYEPIAVIPGENNILMKAGTIELHVPMIS